MLVIRLYVRFNTKGKIRQKTLLLNNYRKF